MSTAQLNGIDVSTWQQTINWAECAPAIDFAMVKATDGVGEVDNQHAANVAGLRAHGKPLGHYHYPEGGDAAAEAHFFVAHAGRLPGELQELDFEGELLNAGDPVGWAAVWMETVIGLTGNRPLIYMSASTVVRFDFARLVALDVGLHVADWNADTPKPGAWPFIIERQTSDRGTVAGIGTAVDKDVFYGDDATWGAYGQNSQPAPPAPAPAPAPPAPPAGDTYAVVQGDNLSVIAARYHVSVADLVAWNEGVYPSLRTNPNLIQVAWVLHVTGPGPIPPNPVPAGEVWHTVLTGDNLSSLAEHFHVAGGWEELVQWNEAHYPSLAHNPNLIGVGWVLRVG